MESLGYVAGGGDAVGGGGGGDVADVYGDDVRDILLSKKYRKGLWRKKYATAIAKM